MAKILTEFLIETREIYIVRRKRYFVRTWCDDCGQEVSMLSPTEAARLMCQDPKNIYSLIDKKHIHFRYLKEETPLVCLRSLCLV
ncbi:MAG TPA: hypothetical protein PKE69_01335 [Pyrinomonadaceae bacterium]|nr:hypothetical protein [Pyrinomonadaceae bacterium]